MSGQLNNHFSSKDFGQILEEHGCYIAMASFVTLYEMKFTELGYGVRIVQKEVRMTIFTVNVPATIEPFFPGSCKFVREGTGRVG